MVKSTMNLNTATAADFEKLVGQCFSVPEVDDCELQLDRVDSLVKHDESSRQPFALVFKGVHTQPLPQGTLELQHIEEGAMQIFLVPIGQTEGAYLYEAVFN
jgi:hypothetical protein